MLLNGLQRKTRKPNPPSTAIIFTKSQTPLPGLFPVVTNHSVITAQVSRRDPSQLHGNLLVQAFQAVRLKAGTMARVAGELLVRTDPRQHDLCR